MLATKFSGLTLFAFIIASVHFQLKLLRQKFCSLWTHIVITNAVQLNKYFLFPFLFFLSLYTNYLLYGLSFSLYQLSSLWSHVHLSIEVARPTGYSPLTQRHGIRTTNASIILYTVESVDDEFWRGRQQSLSHYSGLCGAVHYKINHKNAELHYFQPVLSYNELFIINIAVWFNMGFFDKR